MVQIINTKPLTIRVFKWTGTSEGSKEVTLGYSIYVRSFFRYLYISTGTNFDSH